MKCVVLGVAYIHKVYLVFDEQKTPYSGSSLEFYAYINIVYQWTSEVHLKLVVVFPFLFQPFGFDYFVKRFFINIESKSYWFYYVRWVLNVFLIQSDEASPSMLVYWAVFIFGWINYFSIGVPDLQVDRQQVLLS